MYIQTDCDICKFPGLCKVELSADSSTNATLTVVCGTCQDDHQQRQNGEQLLAEAKS